MDRRQLLAVSVVAAAGFTPLQSLAGSNRSAKGFIRTNWSRDPYSFGSYSFVAKSARRRDHRALGQPVANRLFFAGEATHPDYNSTVHAAYESGLIAAEAIAETDARSVLIIGAGASGLAAADQLTRDGYDVSIWEARDRIGGRIWTDDRLGTPLDLGASWIHGDDGNPLMNLANSLSIETKATDGSFIARGRGGKKLAASELPEWLEEVLTIQHTAGAERDFINGLAYWLNQDYGGEDILMPGGYAPLFDGLLPDLKIQLDQAVEQVKVHAGGVEIVNQTGRSSTADAVLITVPLGVLKANAITFEPPLPAAKQDAIARLGMGVLDKVYLRYDSVFWDADVTWIATPENDLPPGQFNQWFNLYPYVGEPIIMAFNGAQPALDLALLPDDEIAKLAERTLEIAYPG